MWERVVLFPGWVVSLPLVALGAVADRGLLYVEETAFVQRVGAFRGTVSHKAGIDVGLAHLGNRSGLGLKVTGRAPFFGGLIRNWLSVAHSATTRQYHLTEVRALGKPFSLDYTYEWRPRERFYGVGMETSEGDESDYAAKFERVRLGFEYGWNGDRVRLPPRTLVDAWVGPRTTVIKNGRDAGVPPIEERFPALIAPTFGRAFENLTYGASLGSDWRVGEPHWASGWRVLMKAERFDRAPQWLALHTASGAATQFTRLTLEGETAISFYRDPRTIRLMGRIVDQSITAGGERMLVTDLATLGGSQGLGGFQPGRFRDRDLILGRVSYLFPLVRRLEVEMHSEIGGTFPSVWSGTRLDRLEHSFGFALRGRIAEHPLGSVGLDFSREGTRVRFNLGRVD